MKMLDDKFSVKQKTLATTISYVGVGLHTGQKVSMIVKPAHGDSGISFIRKDAPPGCGLIEARWYNVIDTHMSTVLGNHHGVTVSTVEHLMAALHGCGIDNALIEIDGPEVPIMDGSSQPFVSLIEKIGTVSQPSLRKAIWLQRSVMVKEDGKVAYLTPHSEPRITVDIDFPDSAIGAQTYSVKLANEAFRNDIARARTFGFSRDIERLQKIGLAKGGSLRNAVLVDGDRIVNEEGLRFKDEFVRHKILDALGDLSLVGVPILGHYYGYKPGHTINNLLIHKLFEERDAWSYTTVDEFNALIGRRNYVNEKMNDRDMVEEMKQQSSK